MTVTVKIPARVIKAAINFVANAKDVGHRTLTYLSIKANENGEWKIGATDSFMLFWAQSPEFNLHYANEYMIKPSDLKPYINAQTKTFEIQFDDAETIINVLGANETVITQAKVLPDPGIEGTFYPKYEKLCGDINDRQSSWGLFQAQYIERLTKAAKALGKDYSMQIAFKVHKDAKKDDPCHMMYCDYVQVSRNDTFEAHALCMPQRLNH